MTASPTNLIMQINNSVFPAMSLLNIGSEMLSFSRPAARIICATLWFSIGEK